MIQKTSLPYNPQKYFLRNIPGLDFSRFARRYLGNFSLARGLFLFLQLLRCFTSLGKHPSIALRIIAVYAIELPHSEILGLTVAEHLPEAYRSHAASFVATLCQGIHHMLLMHRTHPTNCSSRDTCKFFQGQ